MAGESSEGGVRRRKSKTGDDVAEAAPAHGAASASPSSGSAVNAADQASSTKSPEEVHRERMETFRGFVIRALIIGAGIYFNLPAKENAAKGAAPKYGTPQGIQPVPTAKPAPSIFSALMPVATSPTPPYFSKVLSNAWPPATSCDLRVFLSESKDLSLGDVRDLGLVPVWAQDGMKFNSAADNERAENLTIAVPEAVRAMNGSWWVHAFLAKPSVWATTSDDEFAALDVDNDVLHAKANLIKWVRKRKVEKNLLGGDKKENGDAGKENDADDEGEESDLPEQVMKPVVPLELIYDRTNLKLESMPPNVASEYNVNKAQTMYFPPFLMNEFWIIRDQLRRMNETVAEVTVEMSFRTVSLNWWSVKRSIEGMWEAQQNMGTLRESEPDDLKRMFLDTNPILLGTTMVVSVLHSVLEAMAFKSDISHWKEIKNMEGVSVRSMMWNIVMQMIIFLYLFDNETSWMITIGNGFGIAIEIWKLRKAVKIKSFGIKKLFGYIPWFQLQHDETYSNKTQEYDDEAMKYLSYISMPCVAAYALYSLKYEKHRSWYSWVIGSLVGAVYAFGFLMMLPQVIINYRLKSVAHMPMKAMAFKTVNTVIDDLFSFIIKMPTLHRLACFRDDAVFLVFLYQMYIYPVDKTRVNEFGQRGEGVDVSATDKKEEEKKNE